MFGQDGGERPEVVCVEIPLIQRDYAQGRADPRVQDIRGAFLEALHDALTGGPPLGLDFVYGEVRDGTFEPLDGQQRLTTLFLLHWYLGCRTGHLDEPGAWTRFTYATRPSARLFCERIVANPPPRELACPPSRWITDQQWYLHVWRFDPTIEAMLVMLDAIADRFRNDDLDAVWVRLNDEAKLAVWFQLLPIDEMGSAEDLYIKMNSRGKPLTPFEEFKAHLGQTIAHTGRGEEFGHKIDGPWSDLLWPYRGENDIVDDEFMHLFAFILEICEWREGRLRADTQVRPERRTLALFGEENPRHLEHLAFFFDAFDVWAGTADIETTFGSFFSASAAAPGIRLFGTGPVEVNLLRGCCERYGDMRGNVRAYSLTDTLLLYATLVHRIHDTTDPAGRLRELRNLNEASQFELRVQNMPSLVGEVEEFMRTGFLNGVKTYNQNQVVDEERKREFLTAHPEHRPTVEGLEDQPILRGTLASFDLDAATIAARAAAFASVFAPEHWPALTGALLAVGEYQHATNDANRFRFGSPTTAGVWRDILVDRGDRESLAATRAVLSSLLDTLSVSEEPTGKTLEAIRDRFLTARADTRDFDWRHYMVRYPCMREGDSGIYYGADHALGYEMTMLRRTLQRSWYRDPYLYAIWQEAGMPEEVEDPWFYGYSTEERWMRLIRSGAALRSSPAGIALRAPVAEPHRARFQSVCRNHADIVETDAGQLLTIDQRERDGTLVDTEDRVEKAVLLVRALVSAGL
jgi:hypothetical protein